MSTPLIVVGIDVGGEKKGFHAVALSDATYGQKFASHSAQEVASWCKDIGAQVVGVDAPCRWSLTCRARPAERELASEGVFAFATPTRAVAEQKTFYHWMLKGAELFEVIEQDYRLFDGRMAPMSRVCFETFPHAVACALAEKTVSAKHKVAVRRDLLRKMGIETAPLTNIDIVDAALCAIAAQHLLTGTFRAYGDASQGFIVVPASAGRATGHEKVPPKRIVSCPSTEQASHTSAFVSGHTKTTRIGYENKNKQRCDGHRGAAGTDHGQHAYRMVCLRPECGYAYGANGTDVFQRKCPRCQGGAPGIPF
jgi:predicted nuclease with RNAse H fold